MYSGRRLKGFLLPQVLRQLPFPISADDQSSAQTMNGK
jgi:hypothetical protein